MVERMVISCQINPNPTRAKFRLSKNRATPLSVGGEIAAAISRGSASETPIMPSMNLRFALNPGNSASPRYQFSRL